MEIFNNYRRIKNSTIIRKKIFPCNVVKISLKCCNFLCSYHEKCKYHDKQNNSGNSHKNFVKYSLFAFSLKLLFKVGKGIFLLLQTVTFPIFQNQRKHEKQKKRNCNNDTAKQKDTQNTSSLYIHYFSFPRSELIF